MTDKDAMAMALDALETEVSIDWTNNDEFNASAEKMHEAITALKERLAQPEQEPVAWADHGVVNWIADKQFKHASLLYTTPPQRTEPDDIASILACRDMLDAQPVPEFDRVIWPERTEQEPLAFAGLSITEIRLPTGMTSRFEGGVLIVEAKLKEKNT